MDKKIVWFTEKRKVKDLIPYEKNPRVITDKQMQDLQRSLKKFNLAELPAVNRDGKIVAGHQRIKALLLLGRGEEEIEVRIPSRQLTESEFRDYLLTSNKSGGSFDLEMLASDFDIDELKLSGFDDIDLGEIFDNNIEPVEDDWSDEVEIKKIKKTNIKTGDIYQLGPHRLICGSSLEPKVVEKLMDGAKATLTDNDIPFNILLPYSKYNGTYSDDKSDDEYKVFVKTIMQNALSVTKKDAHVIFWCDERYVWLLQLFYKEMKIDSKRFVLPPFLQTPTLLAELYNSAAKIANCTGGIFNAV